MAGHLYTGKKIFILLHVAGWLLVFLLPLYFLNSEWAGNTSFIGRFYVGAVIYGLVFYVNYIILVPRLFLNKKIIAYVISSLILIFLLFFIEGYTVHYFFDSNPLEKEFGEMMRRFNEEHNLAEPPFRQFHIYNFVFTSILISGFALGLRVFERFKQQEKRQEELVKINLKTELAFLKNQISPHFFFNTLNNIYSLIEINTKHAQDAVIRLSKLMRYLLYESDHIRVNLLDELEFMKNYIELMSLRLSDKVKLEILFPQLKNSYQIPPLLFIPFLENAFKHGVSYKHESYIKISLDILDDMLQFECSNSIINGEEDEKLFSGIGLDNVKKRLELLYPNNYELDMNRSDKVFTVILKIKSLD